MDDLKALLGTEVLRQVNDPKKSPASDVDICHVLIDVVNPLTSEKRGNYFYLLKEKQNSFYTRTVQKSHLFDAF